MTTTTVLTELGNGTLDVVTNETTASFAVRELGVIWVRGTISVESGTVTIVDGQPVSATAMLDAASVSSGSKKRDRDLAGPKFFAAGEHPRMHVRVQSIRPDADGWTAVATISVAGGAPAPMELLAVCEPDPCGGTIRVRATGVLDRSPTPIKMPRAIIGRYIEIEVDATLRPSVG